MSCFSWDPGYMLMEKKRKGALSFYFSYWSCTAGVSFCVRSHTDAKDIIDALDPSFYVLEAAEIDTHLSTWGTFQWTNCFWALRGTRVGRMGHRWERAVVHILVREEVTF